MYFMLFVPLTPTFAYMHAYSLFIHYFMQFVMIYFYLVIIYVVFYIHKNTKIRENVNICKKVLI